MRVTKSKRGLTVDAKLGPICPLYYSTSGPTTALYAFRSTAAARESKKWPLTNQDSNPDRQNDEPVP